MVSVDSERSALNGDVKFMKPLLVVAKICGVKFPENGDKKINLSKIYATILVLTLNGIYLKNIYRKVLEWNMETNYFHAIINVSTSVFRIFINTTIILYPSIFKINQFKIFLASISSVDNYFGEKLPKFKNKAFLIEFLLLHLILFTHFAATIYVMNILYDKDPIYTFGKFTSTYCIILNIFIMYNLILIIKHKFSILNAFVAKEVLLVKTNVLDKTSVHLDHFLTRYEELSDATDHFNDFYGNHIFWTISSFTMETIHGFHVILNCFENPEKTTMKCMHIGATEVSGTLCLMLVTIVFVAACHLATEEAKKIKGLAYKLSLKLLGFEGDFVTENLQEKLAILSDLHECRNPHFTAAGYFDINYGILLTICGYVTTNIIIALSFKF